MCGIFGWISSERPFDADRLAKARASAATLRHRGPDHFGEWHTESAYMGHLRLKIVDLDPRANQPFVSDDGKTVISFNGEIYNYIELRHELEALGHHFRTASDTEVFLSAYRQWGRDAFNKLDGMFAAAFHDVRTDTHLLVRDQMGQKPLYYFATRDKGLIYASELRAILSLNEFDWRLDPAAFSRFLLNSYFARDETPVAGVRKLLPGHIAVFKNGELTCEQYWSSFPATPDSTLSMPDALDAFDEIFADICRVSMRADVPLGVFLSGGIDSSLILHQCHANIADVSAFTVSMADSDFDERSFADRAATHIGVQNVKTYQLDSKGIAAAAGQFLDQLDEPHGDPGFVNALFLARQCRPEITVALAGDGGDELFAGYETFKALAPARYASHLPKPLLEAGRALARHALPSSNAYLGLQYKATAFLRGLIGTPTERYARWLASADDEELARLCPALLTDSKAGTPYEPLTKMMQDVVGRSDQEQLLYFYQKAFLPEFVSLHTDRAAMQASLEVRSPFLSPRMIEFANGIGDGLRMPDGESKGFLKRAMQRRGFPDDLLRRRKQGFTFPVARWLNSGLRDKMNHAVETLADEGTLFDGNELRRLRDRHAEGAENNYRMLFNVIAFQAWRENFPQVSV